MPVEVEIPSVGFVSFPDSMSEDEINKASSNLYNQATATTRSVESPQSEYEEELNRRFKEFTSPPGPVGGAVGALESGIKGAQQIAPVILGKEISRLKTTPGFDAPENIKRQALRDVYGESFRSQVQSMEGAADPEKRADDLYFAYQKRVRDLTEKRNAMLDVWTGVAEQLEKEKGHIPKSKAQQELAAAVTQRDKWSVFRKYPLQVASSIVLESLPPSIAGAVIGAPAGPAGVAVGVGLGGASMEYSSTLLGEASKSGYDISQPGGLVAFLDSPAYDAASDKALIRSGIIGTIDTATAGGAGLFIKPAIKKGLLATAAAAGKETGVQAIGGAGGEFLAQAATKAKGEGFDWFDITMEAVGEAVSAVPEAGIKILSDPLAASAAANGAPATAQAVVGSKQVITGTEVNTDAIQQTTGEVLPVVQTRATEGAQAVPAAERAGEVTSAREAETTVTTPIAAKIAYDLIDSGIRKFQIEKDIASKYGVQESVVSGIKRIIISDVPETTIHQKSEMLRVAKEISDGFHDDKLPKGGEIVERQEKGQEAQGVLTTPERQDPDAVIKMTGQEFQDKMSGFTIDAQRVGEKAKTDPELLAKLERYEQEAKAQFDTMIAEAKASNDIDKLTEATQLSTKKQYFTEALQVARGEADVGGTAAQKSAAPASKGEAAFSGYQFDRADSPTYKIPGIRPGIMRDVSADTARKAGYTVPETIPTFDEWKASQSSDQILGALDKAIEFTNIDPTKALEGVTGLPVWLTKAAANGVLRVIRAAYLGGKDIAGAIKDGLDWLAEQNLQGYNETEARRFINEALAERGFQTVKTDEEKAQEELAIQGDTTKKQFAGYLKAGQERPVENIASVQAVNRQRFFDPTGDITPEKIESAWANAQRMANPQENEEFNREIRAASGREMGPSLLAHDLQHFAFRMVTKGDLSLLNFLRDNWSTMATGGGLTTEAMGRGLRGLVTERTDSEVLRQLAYVFDWRKANTKKSLGVEADEDLRAIKDLLDNLQLTPAQIMEELNKLKDKAGKPVVESIQAAITAATPTLETEESWQDRTARSILDKMESSQTEWVKPDKPKNAIREYVKEALKDTTWPSIDAPENTTRNVEAYLDKVTAELVALEVSEPFARRLAWEIHRERLNRWSLKNLKQAQRNSPDRVVQGFLDRLLSIAPKAPQNAVRKILSDARRRKLVFNDTAQPDEWKGQLSDQLVAAGVNDTLAKRVADELYIAKVPEFATAQAAKFQQAGENVAAIVDALMTALRQQPYRAQNAEWRMATARQYFEDAGLSPSRAEDAARAFDTVFVARESDARAKAAIELIGTKTPAGKKPTGQERAMAKLREAVRIGLTDPNRTWEDTIAALNKWKGFTEAQNNQLAEWIEALEGALPHEYAKLYTKINKLLSTKSEPSTAHELASFYSSNQLSGTGTQLLSYLNPAFSSIIRAGTDAITGIATGDFSKPLFSAKALVTSLKQWSKEYHFAWKHDAYTAQTLRAIERLENLSALMERGYADFTNESLSSTRRAWGLIRYLASFVDIVRQSLQSADQAWQSTIKEWRALVGGRDLMARAGFTTEEIEAMFADAYTAADGYYREAVADGKDDLDAKMEARDRLWQDMEAMFKDRFGDTNGSSVLLAARLESELEVGNHRGEGGFLNNILTGLQAGLQEKHPLLYRMVVGFPRINYNILSRAAWYSPWGWKRLAVDLSERKKGIPPEKRSYKQSMATEIQRRQRMVETITGTVATGIITALYAAELDDKDDDKRFWFDMEGPINPKERSVWLKSGHRPNSLGIKVGDSRVAVNWSRGGIESIQIPIAMMAAFEDRRLNSKDPSALEAAARLTSLLGFTSTGRRDYLTEKGLAYTAASKLSGFVPFAGSLRTINKLVDTRDTTTLNGIIIAATPVAPAFGGKPALNILGEPVAADMTGLKLQRLGLPITIDSPLPLYRLMANKSETPPFPRRDVVEKEIQRPLTDDEWYNYVKTYGGMMKERMESSFTDLKDMEPEQFNKALDRFSQGAKRAAMSEVR